MQEKPHKITQESNIFDKKWQKIEQTQNFKQEFFRRYLLTKKKNSHDLQACRNFSKNDPQSNKEMMWKRQYVVTYC